MRFDYSLYFAGVCALLCFASLCVLCALRLWLCARVVLAVALDIRGVGFGIWGRSGSGLGGCNAIKSHYSLPSLIPFWWLKSRLYRIFVEIVAKKTGLEGTRIGFSLFLVLGW